MWREEAEVEVGGRRVEGEKDEWRTAKKWGLKDRGGGRGEEEGGGLP